MPRWLRGLRGVVVRVNAHARWGWAIALVLSGCGPGTGTINVTTGPPVRAGAVVRCAGKWRNEEERLFEFKMLSSCTTTAPLEIRLYDQLDNLLDGRCAPPPPDPSNTVLMQGRWEDVTLCQKLPHRIMLVKTEVSAPCKPGDERQAVSDTATCEVD